MKRILLSVATFFIAILCSMANTYTVVNTNDAGAGSMRQAISDASGGNDTIYVTSSLAGATITLTSGQLGIYYNLVMYGPASSNIIVDGGGTTGVIYLGNGILVSLQNLNIINGVNNSGGGIYGYADTLNLVNCNITNCTSTGGSGGGIYHNSGTLNMTGCTVSGCSASVGSGGGIYLNTGNLIMTNSTISNNNAVNGGGIYEATTPKLTMNHCTIYGNTASNGGGIYVSDSTALTNCTVYGNSATGNGGGLYTVPSCRSYYTTLMNCTFSSNSANAGSSVYNSHNSCTYYCGSTWNGTSWVSNYCNYVDGVSSTNSIFSCSTGTNFSINSTFTDGGYNISSDASYSLIATGDLVNTNPLINSLASNGGPTLTCALQATSPAINAGTATGAPVTDQRGDCRNGTTDIGAYEYNGYAPPIITSEPSTTTQTGCPGFTVTPLTVVTIGTGLTYQWYSNAVSSDTGGSVIGGATSASYSPPTGLVGMTYYYCIIGNSSCSTTTTASAAITVMPSPAITSQPSTVSQTNCLNFPASGLQVSATGYNITYQWYSNTTNTNTGGSAIGGATSSTYTPNTGTAGTTYYYVTVSGACSPAVTSNVSGAVTVTNHPLATAVFSITNVSCSGCNNGSITVTPAGGTSPYTYSWSPSVSISGSTTASPGNMSASTYTATITDANGCVIRPKVTLSQPSYIINTVAGSGVIGFTGDNAGATSAELNYPRRVAVDGAGNLYIADASNNRIRKVNTSGIISTIAGNGAAGFAGDGTAATSAELNGPAGICVDASGNIYIADVSNNRIRKINTSGVISTIAGTGTPGFSGDGATATAAELYSPEDVKVDAAGNVYIADVNNQRIRKINTSGNISTIAGNGTAGFSGDGFAATAANLNTPEGVAVDTSGNIYIADYANNRVRMVNKSGIISTIAGTGTSGYNGDGIAATSAQLGSIYSVSVDSAGNVFIPDESGARIRTINSTTGIISSIAGTGLNSFGGDGGPATSAYLDGPMGLAISSSGNIYIADYVNQRVRELTQCDLTITAQPSTTAQSVCQFGTAPALSLAVTAPCSSVTYQWYSNLTNANSGGTLVSGATSSSYVPSTTAAGTLYYYCIVSGTGAPVVTSAVSGSVTVTTDNINPVISGMPTDFTVFTSSSCDAPANWVSPTATDNCTLASLTSNWTSGQTFPLGISKVIYTATDLSGNTTVASFHITVRDTSKPVFVSFPSNMIVGICHDTVTYQTPIATDNCAVTVALQSSFVSGSIFPVGTTTVSFTATDSSGNVRSYSFNVTVNPAPVATLTIHPDTVCMHYGPSTLTGGLPTGGTYSGAGVKTNMFTADSAGGGTHLITYTYTDADGCVATATENMDVDICTGIVENNPGLEFSVFPNPSRGIVTIMVSDLSEHTVFYMYNSLGQVIRAIELTSLQTILEHSNLPNGLYMYRIQRGEKLTASGRLIFID